MKYEGEKRSLHRPFVMTVCDGAEVEVSEFDTSVLARTFYEEEKLNTWAKVHAAKWMKELWGLRDDGYYGRIAFEVSSLGWEIEKAAETEIFVTPYFIDWLGKTVDAEATQVFYAGYGFVARKSRS